MRASGRKMRQSLEGLKWIPLFLITGALSQLLSGCGTVDIKSGQASAVDFSEYRTFQFAEPTQRSDPRFFTPKKSSARGCNSSRVGDSGLAPGRTCRPSNLRISQN
jgi:hypothetical protein